MTSLFNTLVRNRREHTPWARINLVAFMREMLWNTPPDAPDHHHPVILTLHGRHDVSSREWWTLEFTDATGQHARVESQYFDLVLWRAAEHEMQMRTREDVRVVPPASDVERAMEETAE